MLSTGCGEAEPVETRVEQAHLQVLGILYGKFLSKSRGQAPADEAEFLGYLNSKRPSWEKIVDSADQLLISPYNEQPLVILYGEQYERLNTNGSLWMAHEQAGAGAQQRVVNIRGDVEIMDTQQLQQLFPTQG